jgi:hypothetical protein
MIGQSIWISDSCGFNAAPNRKPKQLAGVVKDSSRKEQALLSPGAGDMRRANTRGL